MIDPVKQVQINYFQLQHPDIPDRLNRAQIAQLTDLHVGRWVCHEHVEQLVSFINYKSPKVVGLTGDYVGYDARDIVPCIDRLDELQGPTYAVMGNHDHWTGSNITEWAFNQTDIELLINESTVLSVNGADLHIAGVDDDATGHAEIRRTFRDIPPDGFCLTLNHVPSVAPQCVAYGADLILSGHTHGYQLGIPGAQRLAEWFGVQYYAGPYRLGNAFLYVNRGIGSTAWPFRLATHPELAFFQLVSGKRSVLRFLHSETTRLANLPPTPESGGRNAHTNRK